ncbi:MHS family MFS transporter [Planosporangium thailandense]|uniref:MHS family MFS transporter n=1 Tax=Planosporangium thailandense TaxID=765197 RepID=A0ABX0Y6A6_9ACTN|nr:MFS transporter [Planosporangium thailandense]NJC73563.1 MHS family MFS transporter [Planosporangium thailandense]
MGSALEWFDFAMYGALSATVFPALFFAGLGQFGALMASLATFGVGFVARPLGAVVCGYLGDRYGRRPILLATFIAMGASSLAIGLLPANKGATIAVVLVLLRVIQGFALGGEATGAQLMTIENAKTNQRGIFGALINIGSPLSQVLANTALVILGASMSADAFQSWGWRIPFLASLGLMVVGIYIRVRLEETPVFREQKAASDRQVNGLAVLKSQPWTVVKLILVRAGSNVTFYTLAVYGLKYLTGDAGLSRQAAFVIVLIANCVSVAAGLIGGRVSDRIGRKPVLAAAIVAQIIGVAGFFPAAASGNVALIVVTMTLAISAVQFEFGSQPALYAEQFPTSMRFTGSALALSFSQVLFSAPAPLVAAALARSGSSWSIAAVNVVVLVVSVITVRWLRDNYRMDLAEIQPERVAAVTQHR